MLEKSRTLALHLHMHLLHVKNGLQTATQRGFLLHFALLVLIAAIVSRHLYLVEDLIHCCHFQLLCGWNEVCCLLNVVYCWRESM